MQGLLGGEYEIRNGLVFTFGVLGGKYEASPRIGGQIGFAVDLPAIFRHGTRRAIRLLGFNRF